MKISELLRAINEAQEQKTDDQAVKSVTPTSRLPHAASLDDEENEEDEEDLDDEEDGDEGEDTIDLGDLTNYAGKIGDDLWSVGAQRYDGLIDRQTKPAVFTQLNKTAKTLESLKDSIRILKSATKSRDGAISSIIVNGLTGDSAVFYVEPGSEARIIPEDFLDTLEMNQAVKINKILDAGSRYSKTVIKFFDDTENFDLNNDASDDQEQLLWALKYDEQKFPTGRLSPAEKDAAEYMAKRRAEQAKKDAEWYANQDSEKRQKR